LFVIAGIFFLGACLGYTSNDSLNSAAKEAIRRGWAKEEVHRGSIREAWALEVKTHSDLRAHMDREAALWELQVIERERQWEDERVAMDGERRRWAEEREDHERRWEDERAAMDEERRRWADERKERERRQKEKDRQHQEEVEKKRSEIAWGGLQAATSCTSYGVREYTASLFNVPFGFDPIDECASKPVEIDDHLVSADRCENQVRVFVWFLKLFY